jgi:acetyl-CoA synthetase
MNQSLQTPISRRLRGSVQFGATGDPAWVPGADIVARSRLLSAMDKWGIEDIETLHARSVQDPEWFWRAVTKDLTIEFSTDFEKVLDQSDGKELPRWFTGGRLNAATLCASRHATSHLANKEAVVYEGDSGQRRALTYAQLDQEVRKLAANLHAMGVRRGDRVVIFMPVVPEATVAYLAIAAVGAISVPAFSGYGPEALATRLRDSQAVAMITADGTTRRGKPIRMKDTADQALADAPLVTNVIVVHSLGQGPDMVAGRDVYFHELDQNPEPIEFADTESNDPITIIYTSGTTGAPKGIVHSHAGYLTKAATDFAYGFDIHEDDVIAWISDMGWMLGPLMIMGGLQLGATIVMTEGVPDYPTPGRLWEIAERNKVTFQGIAPTAARAVMAHAEEVTADLSSVRSFASTGEAWDEPTWHWLFEQVGNKTRPIVNYTGGTETGGGILVGYPFLPMSVGGFNGPFPGMDVAVLDTKGEPVTGEIGELAMLNTWPGMTHGFWNDRERYLKTYWAQFDGIWIHGDLASVNEGEGWRLFGRSDDTIKVSGRRVGPAEIESALLKDPRIQDAAAVGVPDPARGQRVVVFVTLRDRQEVPEDLASTAEKNIGRAFAPQLHVVNSVPKTKNGKILRRVIRARYLGTPAGDLSSLDPATPLTDIPVMNETGA